MPTLCIAAAQSISVPGNLAANIARHCAFVEKAASAGVQLLLFPELSLSGYEPELVASCVVEPDGEKLAPLRELARKHGMTLVLGAPLASAAGEPYIGAIVLFADGSHLVYRKRHLHHSEERWASQGRADACSFVLHGERFALAICADTNHAEHAAAAAATGAAFYLAGSLLSQNAYAADAAALQGHALQHGYGVLLANHGGPSGDYVAAGRSAFWDAQGQRVGCTNGPGERLLLLRREQGHWVSETIELA